MNEITTHFAWLPTYTEAGALIWLCPYHVGPILDFNVAGLPRIRPAKFFGKSHAVRSRELCVSYMADLESLKI